jgi:hypothetical protein
MRISGLGPYPMGLEMKRDDVDFSGAFNDGYEVPPFWKVIWERLKEKVKNCIDLIRRSIHRRERTL